MKRINQHNRIETDGEGAERKGVATQRWKSLRRQYIPSHTQLMRNQTCIDLEEHLGGRKFLKEKGIWTLFFFCPEEKPMRLEPCEKKGEYCRGKRSLNHLRPCRYEKEFGYYSNCNERHELALNKEMTLHNLHFKKILLYK